LVERPGPSWYRAIAGQVDFTFVLLPSVLGELDELKIAHKNQAVRDAAKSAINRIKGWRHQGPLVNGVTVDKTITVRAHHVEPDMDSSGAGRQFQSEERPASQVLDADLPECVGVAEAGDASDELGMAGGRRPAE
jgi:hypothetical protein